MQHSKIFREADDEVSAGNVSDSVQENFNWDDVTETSVQCCFKTTMVPIALFTYIHACFQHNVSESGDSCFDVNA
ncbi:hypothetical protein RB195_001531 [Necator americanus]|uniref:Uncharacterized protein n=1 Tax=Necator americanus TaxID=51031 RepID=A0ABR1DFY1_NECAM